MLAPNITVRLQVLNDNKAYAYKAFQGDDGKMIPAGILCNGLGLFEDKESGRTEALVIKVRGITADYVLAKGNYEFSAPQNWFKRRAYGYEVSFKLGDENVQMKKIK